MPPRSAWGSPSSTRCESGSTRSASVLPRWQIALRDRLTALAGVRVHDQGRRRCGIVTFTVEGTTAQEVCRRLSEAAVNTSVSLVSYSMLDLPERGLPDLVRASVHYYNTEPELDRLCDVLSTGA